MKVFKNPITGEAFEDISVAKRAYCLTHPCTLGGCKFYEATNGGLCSEWAQENQEEAAELMGLVVEEVEAEPVDKPFTGEIPGEVCSDNRFKLIEEYKTKLINGTNIGAVKEEMAVIDNILFRFWQMGWLDTLEKAYAPTMNTKNMGEKTGDSPARPRLAEVLGVEVGEEFKLRLSKGDIRGPYHIDSDGIMRWNDNGTPMTESLYTAINHPESIIRAPRLTEQEIAIMRAVGAKWVSQNTEGLIRVDLWAVKPFKTSNEIYVAQGIDPIARVKVELFPSVKPGECIEYKKEDTK